MIEDSSELVNRLREALMAKGGTPTAACCQLGPPITQWVINEIPPDPQHHPVLEGHE